MVSITRASLRGQQRMPAGEESQQQKKQGVVTQVVPTGRTLLWFLD
jgi:hypothetical protein